MQRRSPNPIRDTIPKHQIIWFSANKVKPCVQHNHINSVWFQHLFLCQFPSNNSTLVPYLYVIFHISIPIWCICFIFLVDTTVFSVLYFFPFTLATLTTFCRIVSQFGSFTNIASTSRRCIAYIRGFGSKIKRAT